MTSLRSGDCLLLLLKPRGVRTVVVVVFAFFAVILVSELVLINDNTYLRSQGALPVVHSASPLLQRAREQGGGVAGGEDVPSQHTPPPRRTPRAEQRPNTTAQDGVWQPVVGTRDKFAVYSAFLDGRGTRKLVRIIAAARTKSPDRVWCRLWYPARSLTLPAVVKVIRENWRLRYSACYVLCPLWRNLTTPVSVSVVSELHSAAGNHLLVHSEPGPGASTLGIAVCVKPLHYLYNKPLQMLEFLELYSMLGIHHFTLYNHTIGPEVACVLEDYISRGTVTMFPWQLNMVSQKEIRTEGLFAALNDCLYRSMYRYSYVVLVDLDEYIMPRYNDTLQDLIKWLDDQHGPDASCYLFQNAFFYLQWEDDEAVLESDDLLEKRLTTVCKTRRSAQLHPHRKRSKYMCRPEHVVEAGNHFVWQLMRGRRTLNVPPGAAILHHYRVCEFGGDDCVKTASTLDRTAHRYRERLVESVSARWRQLRRLCQLPALWEQVITAS